MTGEELFALWAPSQSVWSDWAAPAVFAHLVCIDATYVGTLPDPGAIKTFLSSETAVVLDLPGEESVWRGLSLANLGYRPVPLFNNAPGPGETILAHTTLLPSETSVVNMSGIASALCQGAAVLAGAGLQTDAPPAFLLDANRLRGTQPLADNLFDNRWMVFPQDFPSASFLAAKRISRVLLMQEGATTPQEDLAHVLRRWQEAGIEIYAKDIRSSSEISPITVKAPSQFRAAWYRALAVLGLRRNSAGGFGSATPESWSAG
jgi:hypothetical protein